MARGEQKQATGPDGRVMDERRQFRRTQKRIRLGFQKRKFLFLKGPVDAAEAVDISSTGVRLNTRMELAEDDPVTLIVRRTDDEPEVPLDEKVVWTKPMKKDGQSFVQAGIEFVRLRLKQRVLLVRLTTGI